MIEILPLAIGVGLVVSLLFSEVFGVAAGGMVVPGYLALYLDRPMYIVLTFGTGIVTYAIVESLSTFMIVYGRRRITLMILVGFLLGVVVQWSFEGWLSSYAPGADVIGYIIPGLIALWISRQGVVVTLATAVTASVVVRLVLLLILGEEISP